MILSRFAATYVTGLGGSASGMRKILGHPYEKYMLARLKTGIRPGITGTKGN